jgi:homoserine acetyltransferase
LKKELVSRGRSDFFIEDFNAHLKHVIKFVSDMRHVGRFSPGSLISSTNKTDYHDITEILLKVVLNTITLTPILKMKVLFIL